MRVKSANLMAMEYHSYPEDINVTASTTFQKGDFVRVKDFREFFWVELVEELGDDCVLARVNNMISGVLGYTLHDIIKVQRKNIFWKYEQQKVTQPKVNAITHQYALT